MGNYHSEGLSESPATQSAPAFSDECRCDPHEPTCGNCKWFGWYGGEDDSPGICKRHAPNNRKNPPWPEIDCCTDGCADHQFDIRQLQSECNIETRTKIGQCERCNAIVAAGAAPKRTPSVAPVGAISSEAPPAPVVKRETDRHRETREAYELMAGVLDRVDVPLTEVRDMFMFLHRVAEADPVRARKKKLDAWAWAKKNLPPGFEVVMVGPVQCIRHLTH